MNPNRISPTIAGALYLEFTLIFIGLPIVFYFDLIPLPKLPSLVAFTVYALVILWFDRTYDKSNFLRWDLPRLEVKNLAVRFLLFSIFILAAAWYFLPHDFLIIPKERPQLWVIIMLFYPFVSALPQELIYRSFFFQRYSSIFPRKWILILASTLAFAFLHIIYDNFVAIIFTLAGGYLFSRTYERTNSLLAASLEHALYGCMIFTSGFGSYFYEPFNG